MKNTDFEIKENQKTFIKRYIIAYIIFFFINISIELEIYYHIHYLNIAFFIYLIPLVPLLFFYFRSDLLMKISFRLLVNLVSVLLFLLLYISDIIYFFPFTTSHIIFYFTFPSSFYMVNSLKQTIIYTSVVFALLALRILFCFYYANSIDIFIFYKGTSETVGIIQDTFPIFITVITIILHYSYLINKTRIETFIKNKSQIIYLNDEENSKTARERNLEKLYYKIINVLESDKLYLDPYLSLDDLTEHLNSNKTYISNALNQIGKTNFYEIVNQYRIKNVVYNLNTEKNKRFKINNLYKKAGFLYQPHFNRAFKKETGMSPTEYIKSLENTENKKQEII